MTSPRILAALGAFALLAAAGCSASASGDDPSAQTTAPTDTASSASTPAEDSTSTEDTTPDGVINALEATGPASTATIPDVEPVIDGASPSFPTTVTDATGEEITIDGADRVLSLDLYGTLTDTIVALGLQENLVGRANSDLQESLQDLPVVTQNGHDISIEAVLDLQPDLILTNTTIGSDTVYDQLEAGGVTVVRFEHTPSFEGISTTIEAVGAAFGMGEEASTLAEHTQDELDEALQYVDTLSSATPQAPRAIALYVRGTAGVFFILGADYGAADVLDALNLEDTAAENGITDINPANAEALLSLDPEIVLAMEGGVESTGGIDGLLERPGMAATTAGENERVITAPDTQLLAYGPRTPEAVRALGEAIYTEQ